ncbi:hypothetical protein ANO11243_027260 [Dothideomycetidae sp. 11243]|nr:hypothetical protein ANO11243_027260 [fungal sp. No.11243]
MLALPDNRVPTSELPSGLTKHLLSRHDSAQECDSLQRLSNELHDAFEVAMQPERLQTIAQELQTEYAQKLQHSPVSMLPSYHQTLPSGLESGSFVSIDVGGTNLRVAVIDLNGRGSAQDDMCIKRICSFRIDAVVRRLRALEFFDWIAERVDEVLGACHVSVVVSPEPIRMGLAWSFPIEQTSHRSGTLLQMGKGFTAADGTQDQPLDLCELITDACKRRGLEVQLQAIVNDASATLLAQAYREPSTRFSLILGTGVNSAAFLPLRAVAPQKYASRSQMWREGGQNVIVNTELSMHGLHLWPMTRWDERLAAAHALPDFQPLEQKVSGLYLGEIVRHVLVEAITSFGLFAGVMPSGLTEPYSLCTSVLAAFESDVSHDLDNARQAFIAAHAIHHEISTSDMYFVRSVCQLVSARAAAFVATAVYALCRLASEYRTEHQGAILERVTIAGDGSVLEKYPGFLERCQQYIDALSMASGCDGQSITLAMVKESCVLGAAVAAACE